MKVDSLPYNTYKKIRGQYSGRFVLLTDDDLGRPGLHLAFKTHREYVEYRFKQIGIEITQWAHNYDSLSTSHPQLGVIFLANDSSIVPGMEAHVLVGHNARYVEGSSAAGDTL